MTSRTRHDWSDAELAILRDNPHLPTSVLKARLPNRSSMAIGNKRKWFSDNPVKCEGTPENPEVPPTKDPGDYIETLSSLLVEDFECMEIWCKWNGYASWRELGRDMGVGAFGVVSVLCTAK